MLGFPNILAELELLKIISWKVKQIKIILGLEHFIVDFAQKFQNLAGFFPLHYKIVCSVVCHFE